MFKKSNEEIFQRLRLELFDKDVIKKVQTKY